MPSFAAAHPPLMFLVSCLPACPPTSSCDGWRPQVHRAEPNGHRARADCTRQLRGLLPTQVRACYVWGGGGGSLPPSRSLVACCFASLPPVSFLLAYSLSCCLTAPLSLSCCLSAPLSLFLALCLIPCLIPCLILCLILSALCVWACAPLVRYLTTYGGDVSVFVPITGLYVVIPPLLGE
jgi:hypothetical protein